MAVNISKLRLTPRVIDSLLFVSYVVMAVSLWFFLFRHLRPIFLADELLFAADIWGGNPWAASLGNPVQVALLSWLTSSQEWYSGVKLVHSAFLGVGAGFSFLLLRLRFGRWISFLGGLVYISSPVALFASSTMSEGLVYSLFPIILFLLVRYGTSQSKTISIGLWLGLSVITLIKPHFLILAIAIVALTPLLTSSHWKFHRKLFDGAIRLVGFMSVRTVVGFVTGGFAGISPVGRYLGLGLDNSFFYPNVNFRDFDINLLPEAAANVSTSLSFSEALVNSGPLYLFFILMGVGPLALLASMAQRQNADQDHVEGFNYPFTRALFLSSIVGVVLLYILGYLFGGYASFLGDDHSSRVLLRYMEPYWLSLIFLGLLLLPSKVVKLTRIQIVALAITLGPLVLYSFGALSGFSIGGTDSVLFASFIGSIGPMFLLTGGLAAAILLLGLAVIQFKVATTTVLLLLAIPLSANSAAFIDELSQSNPRSVGIEESKQFEKPLFIAESRAIGAEAVMLTEELSGRYAIAPLGVSFRAASVKSTGRDTFIFLGDLPVLDGFEMVRKGTGFQIAKLGETSDLDKSSEILDASIGEIAGLGASAFWGYWADGDRVTIELAQAMQKSRSMQLGVTRHPLTSSSTLVITTNNGDSVEIELGDGGEFGTIDVGLPPNTTTVELELKSTAGRLIGENPELKKRFSDSFGLGLTSVTIR